MSLLENYRYSGVEVVAGFPCQPFSIAGVSKKNSLGRATGFEDKTQGTLFFDVCRILQEKRPKAFMLENVKNLCSHGKGRTFKEIRESLDGNSVVVPLMEDVAKLIVNKIEMLENNIQEEPQKKVI